ncbi:unnamed protein product [Ilex paraguariensis]
MCLRFKAENLNQQQLIEQLPKSLCTNIRQHLFLPTVEKVYLFKGVSMEILLLLVADMKAEYIPPREDVILQNEAPDDIYIIVSGELEMIEGEMGKERVIWSLKSGDMFGEVADDPNMSINLLTVASTGNAAFLDELLKAKLDPDIGDSKGRTPLHIAASKGHEECVSVLLKHACNIHLQADVDGNTAMWDAIAAKYHSIFRMLYHYASISDPYTAGDLLCTAAKRNDLKLLVINGADVNYTTDGKLPSVNLDEMLQKREVGHWITMPDTTLDQVAFRRHKEEQEYCNVGRSKRPCSSRVSIYRGHPLVRRETCYTEAGRLIRLPNSPVELKSIAGTV